MKNFLLSNSRITLLAFAAVLFITVASEPQAYGQQQPCVSSSQSVNQAIQNLQSQGATVTCDSSNMYVTFPSGLYFNLSIPDSGAARLFFFNPVNGQTTYMYITDGTLWIQDSTYGFINAGDGWYSIFYPVGNPFSAAIQDPMQALFQTNAPSSAEDPFYTGGGGHPAPLQP
jgi:hypothetical protein